MVPADLQAEVHRTLKLRAVGVVDATWAPWWRAQAEAAVAVMRQVYPTKVDLIDNHLARAMSFAETLEDP
jgi:hypothetical protein